MLLKCSRERCLNHILPRLLSPSLAVATPADTAATTGGERWLPAALYTDDPPEDVEHATQTVIMERRPLLLTPVPCEQEWATAAWAGKPVEPQTPRE